MMPLQTHQEPWPKVSNINYDKKKDLQCGQAKDLSNVNYDKQSIDDLPLQECDRTGFHDTCNLISKCQLFATSFAY